MQYLSYKPNDKERDQAIVEAVEDNIFDYEGNIPLHVRNQPNPSVSLETVQNVQKLFDINISRNPNKTLTPREILYAQSFFIEFIEIIGSSVHAAIPVEEKIDACRRYGLEKAVKPYVVKRWSKIDSSDLDIRSHKNGATELEIENMTRVALKTIAIAERGIYDESATLRELCKKLRIPNIAVYNEANQIKYRLLKLDNAVYQLDLVSGTGLDFTLFEHTNLHFKVDRWSLKSPTLSVSYVTEDNINYLQAILLHGYGIILTRNPESKDYRGAMNYLSAVMKGFIELKNSEYAIYLKMLLEKYSLDSHGANKFAQHITRLIGAHHTHINRAVTFATLMFELSLPDNFNPHYLNLVWSELFKDKSLDPTNKTAQLDYRNEPIAVLRYVHKTPARLIEAALASASIMTLCLPTRELSDSKHRVDFTNPYGPPMLGIEFVSNENEKRTIHHLPLLYDPLHAIQSIERDYFSKPELHDSPLTQSLIEVMMPLIAPGAVKNANIPPVIKYQAHLQTEANQALPLITKFVETGDPFLLLASTSFLTMYTLHGNAEAEKLLFEILLPQIIQCPMAEVKSTATSCLRLVLYYLCPEENKKNLLQAVWSGKWDEALYLTFRPTLCSIVLAKNAKIDCAWVKKLIPYVPYQVLLMLNASEINSHGLSSQDIGRAVLLGMKQANVSSSLLLSYIDSIHAINSDAAFWIYWHARNALNKEAYSPLRLVEICSKPELLTEWKNGDYWMDACEHILLPLALEVKSSFASEVFSLVDPSSLSPHKKAQWIELLYEVIQNPAKLSLENLLILSRHYQSITLQSFYLEILFVKQLESGQITQAISTLLDLRDFHTQKQLSEKETLLISSTTITAIPNDRQALLFFSQVVLRQIKASTNLQPSFIEIIKATFVSLEVLEPFPTHIFKNLLIELIKRSGVQKKEYNTWICTLGAKLIRETLSSGQMPLFELSDIALSPFFVNQWRNQNSENKEIRILLLQLVHKLIIDGSFKASDYILRFNRLLSLNPEKNESLLLASLGRHDKRSEAIALAAAGLEQDPQLIHVYLDLLIEQLVMDFDINDKLNSSIKRLLSFYPQLMETHKFTLRHIIQRAFEGNVLNYKSVLDSPHAFDLLGSNIWFEFCGLYIKSMIKSSQSIPANLLNLFVINLSTITTLPPVVIESINDIILVSAFQKLKMPIVDHWKFLEIAYPYLQEKSISAWNEQALALLDKADQLPLYEIKMAILTHKGIQKVPNQIITNIDLSFSFNISNATLLCAVIDKYPKSFNVDFWATLWQKLTGINSREVFIAFFDCWERWRKFNFHDANTLLSIYSNIISSAHWYEKSMAYFIENLDVTKKCINTGFPPKQRGNVCQKFIEFANNNIERYFDVLQDFLSLYKTLENSPESILKINILILMAFIGPDKPFTLSNAHNQYVTALVLKILTKIRKDHENFKVPTDIIHMLLDHSTCANQWHQLEKDCQFNLFEMYSKLILYRGVKHEKLLPVLDWLLRIPELNVEKINELKMEQIYRMIEFVHVLLKLNEHNKHIIKWMQDSSNHNYIRNFANTVLKANIGPKHLLNLKQTLNSTYFSDLYKEISYSTLVSQLEKIKSEVGFTIEGYECLIVEFLEKYHLLVNTPGFHEFVAKPVSQVFASIVFGHSKEKEFDLWVAKMREKKIPVKQYFLTLEALLEYDCRQYAYKQGKCISLMRSILSNHKQLKPNQCLTLKSYYLKTIFTTIDFSEQSLTILKNFNKEISSLLIPYLSVAEKQHINWLFPKSSITIKKELGLDGKKFEEQFEAFIHYIFDSFPESYQIPINLISLYYQKECFNTNYDVTVNDRFATLVLVILKRMSQRNMQTWIHYKSLIPLFSNSSYCLGMGQSDSNRLKVLEHHYDFILDAFEACRQENQLNYSQNIHLFLAYIGDLSKHKFFVATSPENEILLVQALARLVKIVVYRITTVCDKIDEQYVAALSAIIDSIIQSAYSDKMSTDAKAVLEQLYIDYLRCLKSSPIVIFNERFSIEALNTHWSINPFFKSINVLAEFSNANTIVLPDENAKLIPNLLCSNKCQTTNNPFLLDTTSDFDNNDIENYSHKIRDNDAQAIEVFYQNLTNLYGNNKIEYCQQLLLALFSLEAIAIPSEYQELILELLENATKPPLENTTLYREACRKEIFFNFNNRERCRLFIQSAVKNELGKYNINVKEEDFNSTLEIYFQQILDRKISIDSWAIHLISFMSPTEFQVKVFSTLLMRLVPSANLEAYLLLNDFIHLHNNKFKKQELVHKYYFELTTAVLNTHSLSAVHPHLPLLKILFDEKSISLLNKEASFRENFCNFIQQITSAHVQFNGSVVQFLLEKYLALHSLPTKNQLTVAFEKIALFEDRSSFVTAFDALYIGIYSGSPKPPVNLLNFILDERERLKITLPNLIPVSRAASGSPLVGQKNNPLAQLFSNCDLAIEKNDLDEALEILVKIINTLADLNIKPSGFYVLLKLFLASNSKDPNSQSVRNRLHKLKNIEHVNNVLPNYPNTLAYILLASMRHMENLNEGKESLTTLCQKYKEANLPLKTKWFYKMLNALNSHVILLAKNSKFNNNETKQAYLFFISLLSYIPESVSSKDVRLKIKLQELQSLANHYPVTSQNSNIIIKWTLNILFSLSKHTSNLSTKEKNIEKILGAVVNTVAWLPAGSVEENKTNLRNIKDNIRKIFPNSCDRLFELNIYIIELLLGESAEKTFIIPSANITRIVDLMLNKGFVKMVHAIDFLRKVGVNPSNLHNMLDAFNNIYKYAVFAEFKNINIEWLRPLANFMLTTPLNYHANNLGIFNVLSAYIYSHAKKGDKNVYMLINELFGPSFCEFLNRLKSYDSGIVNDIINLLTCSYEACSESQKHEPHTSFAKACIISLANQFIKDKSKADNIIQRLNKHG